MNSGLTDAVVNAFVRARFRYDIFLSYSRADGSRYAARLRDELARLDYSCFLDTDEAPAGAPLSRTLQRALDVSAVLVIVGSRGASKSHYVANEIAHFAASGRDVLPINVGSAPDAQWGRFRATDHIWIDETEAGLSAGLPSAGVIDAIEKRFRYTRRNVRVRVQIAAAGAIFVLGALIAGVLLQREVRNADLARREAQRQQKTAEAATVAATSARAAAETSRAEAVRQQEFAEQRRAEAERAAADAARQQLIAESRSLAAQAEQTLIVNPTDAFSLALRSYRVAATAEARAVIASTFPRVITTSKRRAREVTSAMFSRDGRWVLTAGADGTVEVWNAIDGFTRYPYPRTPLRANGSRLSEATFSHDEQRVVTAGEDSMARVWNVVTGDAGATLQGHTARVRSAAFSPDDTRILTVSDDATARLWEVSTGKAVATLQAAAEYLSAAQFAPTGDRIVSSADAGIQLWEASTGRPLIKLDSEAGTYATFSRDGRRVAANGGGRVRIFSAETGRVQLELGPPSGAAHFTFSRDDRRVVTAGVDGTARVWDALTGATLLVLRGHTAALTRASFSPDDRWIVTASEDRTARIWSAATGDLLATLGGHAGTVADATMSSEGLVVTVSEDLVSRVWILAAAETLVTIRTADGVRATYSPDGTHVLTTTNNGLSEIWSAADGRRVATLRGRATGVRYSPDGSRLVGRATSGVAVWRASTGEQLLMLPHPEYSLIDDPVLSPDGARILTTGSEFLGGPPVTQVGFARMWDALTGRELAKLDLPRRGDTAVFSADGRRILTRSDDGSERIWDADTGELVTIGKRSGEPQMDTPDASTERKSHDLRVVVSNDFVALVSDVRTDRPVVVLGDERSRVDSASISPDGQRVLASSGRFGPTTRIYRVLALVDIERLLKR